MVHVQKQTRAATATAAGLLVLCGCTSGSSQDSHQTTPSTTPRTTVASTKPTIEPGTTAPGTTLKVGKTATVRFRANRRHNSLVAVMVRRVRRGKISDLSKFTLTPKAKASNVYYVHVVVRNKGTGDLGGQQLPLYALVSPTLVVPPVTFSSTLVRCPNKRFAKPFKKNARATLCMVFLAPKHGKVYQIQWRAPRATKPVSWKVRRP